MPDSNSLTNFVEGAASGGRVELYPGVRCITYNSASHSEFDMFDVPDDSITDGRLMGIKVAFELLRDGSVRDPADISGVILAACEVAHAGPINHEAISKVGAAYGFIEAIANALCALADEKRANAVYTRLIRDHNRYLLEDARAERKSNTKFIRNLTKKTDSEVEHA